MFDIRLLTSHCKYNHARMKIAFLLLLFVSPVNGHLLIDIIGKFVESLNIQLDSPKDEQIFQEATSDVTRVVSMYGYPAENHSVHTHDGYILTMHRIPHGKLSKQGKAKRQPVLIIHGLVSTSQDVIDSGPSNLAFYLADHGFDVWLGNLRGNVYTQNKKYKNDQKEFWDFSWQEIAEFDIPVMIDYILENTQFQKLPYIGHSMGTTVGFAFFSTQLNYHKKVSGYIALSPITTLLYAPTLFKSLTPAYRLLGAILDLLGLYSVPYIESSFFKLEENLCPYPNPKICSLILNLAEGYSNDIRNMSRDFLYANHASDGASIRCLQHYAQTITKRGMYKFDFGLIKNLAKYHTLSPPKYPLSAIEIPVVFFHSANDPFADPIDVLLLSRKIPNLLGMHLVGPPMMTHLDMLAAANGPNIYFDKILTYLKKFNT